MKKIVLLFCIAILFFSCTPKEKDATISFEAMNTWMNIHIWGDEDCDKIAEDAKEAILNLDALISTTNQESEIASINKLTEKDDVRDFELSSLVHKVMTAAFAMAEETDGVFNPCLYPVTKSWGFTTEKYTVPEVSELEKLLKKTDFTQVKLDEKVSVPQGMMFDFGGIGKGFAGDYAIELLKKAGIKAGLLDLGGNVQAFGTKPDGSPWKIGIRNPVGEGIIAGVQIKEGTVITSGGYERFFIADDGNKYIHIIDPKTGMPVDNGLVSVTVIASSGTYADALSTALFVMGKEKAIEFWKSNEGEEFQFVIMSQSDDEKLEIYYTEGLEENISVLQETKEINIVGLN